MAPKTGKIVIFGLLVVAAGCTNVFRPYADAQPDEGLFGRAMQSLANGRYRESRSLLKTLIATYPESAYAPRAELALDDIWRAEGGLGPRRETPPDGGMTFFPALEEKQAR
jgi:outer membrane protein assembly factor BamD (BamD/ComL family)